MSNKILITGATSGLGKAIAIHLASKDNEIIILGRNPSKLSTTYNEISNITNNSNLETITCDLSSFEQTRKAAKDIGTVDTLINNAGGIYSERTITENNNELTFQVNYLSHFLLTKNINIKNQILNLSSVMHKFGDTDFENASSGKYFAPKAYAQSKLASVLFTYELAKRNPNLRVNCYDPGFIKTNVGHGGYVSTIMKLIKPFFSSPETAAKEVASILEKKLTGEYYHHDKAVKSSKKSYNEILQHKLWKLSEMICE